MNIDLPLCISFSGGRTSGMMLRLIFDHFGGTLPGQAKVIFCNTGKERSETLDFVHEVEMRWCPITWLEYDLTDDNKHAVKVVSYETASRNGEPFEKVIQKRNYLPNPIARFCTVEMKILTAERYLKILGWDQWTNAVGIRADEPNRLAKGRKTGRKSYENWHPLAELGITEADVLSFWKSQPFDLQLESYQGNCDLCFLKGAGRIRRIIRENPELVQWWIDQEEKITHAHGGKDRFRRDRPLYRIQLELAQRPGLFDAIEAEDELSIACHCTD